jgi:hypothetical protein
MIDGVRLVKWLMDRQLQFYAAPNSGAFVWKDKICEEP